MSENKGCDSDNENSAFQNWFVDCIISGSMNEDCPDSYVWNMIDQCENGGEWLDMFRSGISPEAAVKVKFSGLKLNA